MHCPKLGAGVALEVEDDRVNAFYNVLYCDFVKQGIIPTTLELSRSKARAQAISQPGDDYDRLR